MQDADLMDQLNIELTERDAMPKAQIQLLSVGGESEIDRTSILSQAAKLSSYQGDASGFKNVSVD